MDDELMLLPEDRELVAHLNSGGWEMPALFEKDIFLLGVDVAGPEYNANIMELYDELEEGGRVRLVREPDNPYDKYAIRIDVIEDGRKKAKPEEGKLTADGGIKLGYVPRRQQAVCPADGRREVYLRFKVPDLVEDAEILLYHAVQLSSGRVHDVSVFPGADDR